MTQIHSITVDLDVSDPARVMLEVSLNDGTGDIPEQFTRTHDALWLIDWIDETDHYHHERYDTAIGAYASVCRRWSLDPDDYPDACMSALAIDEGDDHE